MKRIKSVNGYTIYQAVTTRDADNHNCHVGSYNIYLSSDIRDFGLTNSYPEWEDEDSLAVAIARCKGSNYAVAVALADELSDSTVQDMDLCLEIERRLDAGDSISGIIDCYDRETGRLYATVSEAIAAGYEPYMDDYAAGLVEDFEDDMAELDDSPAGEPQPAPKQQEHRSHASYYVVGSDGTYYTKTVGRTEGLEDYELYKRAFFRAVAERIAMSDCGDDTVEEIVYDGEPCHYTGWQPGMVIEFASDITGEIVYSGSFPEWDH